MEFSALASHATRDRRMRRAIHEDGTTVQGQAIAVSPRTVAPGWMGA